MPIKVAIVEDNTELRESLSQLISGAEGFTCAGACADCESFLANVREINPDIVLMDIGLPGMSGIEAVKKLRETSLKPEVLMLTVYEDDQRIFDSVCAGASGYLLKRTPPSRILDAIKELSNGGAPMTPKIARRVLELFQSASSRHVPADYRLSDREKEILTGLVQGLSYKMIAGKCSISIDTVRSHIKHIYEKLHVNSKGQAISIALKSRLV